MLLARYARSAANRFLINWLLPNKKNNYNSKWCFLCTYFSIFIQAKNTTENKNQLHTCYKYNFYWLFNNSVESQYNLNK